jgi:N-acetylglutamate synthase-like GNAT family acetyltransferase
VTIRPARSEDKGEILALVTTILNKEFPSDSAAYATDDLEDLLESYRPPKNLFLVAQADRRIIGTCGVKGEDKETALLRRLFVEEGHRGQGIGRTLLQRALQFCRERGLKEAIIRTSAGMVQAIRLCRELGFQEDGSWALGGVTLVRFRLKMP